MCVHSQMTEICRSFGEEKLKQDNTADSRGRFRPELSEKSKKLAQQRSSKELLGSSQASQEKQMTPFEKLLARGDERNRRKETLRQDLLKEAMAECTFKPNRVTANYDGNREQTAKGSRSNAADTSANAPETLGDVTVSIIDANYQDDDDDDNDEDEYAYQNLRSKGVRQNNFFSSRGLSGVPGQDPVMQASDIDVNARNPEPAYQRLYKLREKAPNTHQHQHSSIVELQSCTFKPVVDRSTMNLPTTAHTESETKSVEKSVARMAKAREMRRQEAEKFAQLGQVDETSYARAREQMAQGPVPFSFQMDERQRIKDHKKQATKKPR
jgi:hypothetical protein